MNFKNLNTLGLVLILALFIGCEVTPQTVIDDYVSITKKCFQDLEMSDIGNTKNWEDCEQEYRKLAIRWENITRDMTSIEMEDWTEKKIKETNRTINEYCAWCDRNFFPY